MEEVKGNVRCLRVIPFAVRTARRRVRFLVLEFTVERRGVDAAVYYYGVAYFAGRVSVHDRCYEIIVPAFPEVILGVAFVVRLPGQYVGVEFRWGHVCVITHRVTLHRVVHYRQPLTRASFVLRYFMDDFYSEFFLRQVLS